MRTIKSMENKYLDPSLELVEGALDNMSGLVDYSFYETLHED